MSEEGAWFWGEAVNYAVYKFHSEFPELSEDEFKLLAKEATRNGQATALGVVHYIREKLSTKGDK